jgi:hypothetical protein
VVHKTDLTSRLPTEWPEYQMPYMQGSHHRANSDSCKLNQNGLLFYFPAPIWPGFLFIKLQATSSTLCVFAPIYLGLDVRELWTVLVFQRPFRSRMRGLDRPSLACISYCPTLVWTKRTQRLGYFGPVVLAGREDGSVDRSKSVNRFPPLLDNYVRSRLDILF